MPQRNPNRKTKPGWKIRLEAITASEETNEGFIWFGLVLWYIKHSRIANAKSIFIHINSSISNNSDEYKYCYILHTVKCQSSHISNNAVLHKYIVSMSKNSSISNNPGKHKYTV